MKEVLLNHLVLAPALVTFVAKLHLLVKHRHQPWASESWVFFVIILSFYNLVEFLLIFSGLNIGYIAFELRMYHVMVLICGAYGVNYVIDPSSEGQRQLVLMLLGGTISVSAFVLVTDSVVYGSQIDGWRMLADKGKHYVSFKAFAIFQLMCTLILLVVNTYRYRKDVYLRTIYFGIIRGLMPLFLVTVYLVVTVDTPYAISPFMIVPFGCLWFLQISIKSRKKAWYKRQAIYTWYMNPDMVKLFHQNVGVAKNRVLAEPDAKRDYHERIVRLIRRASSANDG